MIDSFRHKGLRKKLVEELQSKGVTNKAVLEAIGTIPRHLFLDSSFLEFAYQDNAFPIGAGQTISQPYTVAVQSTLLDISKNEKVLEIGTGSGYQAAVLHLMGAKVFSIERQRELFVKTKSLLTSLDYRIKLFFGDGYQGLPSFAPFDKIIITCGAPFVPEKLLEQLKPNGILVIPLGEDIQTMTTITKKSDTEFIRQEHGQFRFVPMLENKSDKK
ncbi:MAG: protein-L-isoaspartate(D-aspartate) O-methyltransferase [Bacteroidota bacterium]|jgi:protein-L-isoaspartate(D-aspartate) O-methyltransferase